MTPAALGERLGKFQILNVKRGDAVTRPVGRVSDKTNGQNRARRKKVKNTGALLDLFGLGKSGRLSVCLPRLLLAPAVSV